MMPASKQRCLVSHSNPGKRNCKLGEYIHSDICGPIQVDSLERALYFIVFKSEKSGYRLIYVMRHKSEALGMFKKFQARVEAETGTRIKNLRSDNAKEYVSKEFESFLDHQKIVFRPSVEYALQENGTAEREMRYLCALGRAMLKSADLPGSLWSEAIKTAAYIMNRVLNRRDKITPYEQWHGNKPSVAHLRVFGCKAYTWIPEVKRKKLDDRAAYGRLVGYGDSHKIFRVYHPGSRQVDVSRDVDFEKEDNVKRFPRLRSDNDSDTKIEDTGSDDSGSDSEHEEEERKSPVKQKVQDEDIFISGASGSSVTPVREKASTQEPPAVRRKPGRPPRVKNGPKKQVPE